jgi:hypothetical protein
MEHGKEHTPAASRLDGHRLAEFIYGAVIGLVAVMGVGDRDSASWWSAALTIMAGAVAIWVAHAYSMLISKRVLAGRPLNVHEMGETLAGSWPIVLAGMLLTIPLLPVAVGLWPLDLALRASSIVGILILALVGVLAGVLTNESWPRRILLAALSAGLGLAVVAIEFVLHH